MPCNICVTINDLRVIGVGDDCGVVCPTIAPWQSNIETPNPHALGGSAYYSDIFFIATPDIDNFELFTYIQCEFPGDPPKWHFLCQYSSSRVCVPGDGQMAIEDVFDLTCPMIGEIFGTHTIEVTIPDNFGHPITLHVQYTVTPGTPCGISTSCCATPISKWLKASVNPVAASTSSAEMLFGGTEWDFYLSLTSNPFTVGRITCVASVWHGYFETVSGVVFDADLTGGDGCIIFGLTGIDATHGTTCTVNPL